VPAELKSKCNNLKNRILFLAPSVSNGEERECRRDDFESLSNKNIGVGGFGKVYKVRHKTSKNIYAIKVINKSKIIEHDLVEQIKLEVEIMYKLNHKHVVKLYNHYEDDDSFYLILEFAA
jgi:serine/threonine protein kinase